MATDRLLSGRYRLLSVLGRGGMGTVWAARDEVLGRPVAVKEVVPPVGLPDEERRIVRQRSLREARAAARISHPAAVTVYDVVDEDGRLWIVMQLLEARSLADELATGGPLDPARAARVGLDLLDALGAAHAAGVLHRDVKPANVMLTGSSGAVLTDFGIATVEGDPTLTTTGLIVGSPAYLSPERARGEVPSPASDLFSLGATLFAAVEGRSPFQRDGQLSTLHAVIGGPVPPAPRAGPLAPVIEELLHKDPAARPTVDRARVLLREALAAAMVPEEVEDAPSEVAPAVVEEVSLEVEPEQPQAADPAPPPAPSSGPPPAQNASAHNADVRDATTETRPAGRRGRATLLAAASLLVAGLLGAVLWLNGTLGGSRTPDGATSPRPGGAATARATPSVTTPAPATTGPTPAATTASPAPSPAASSTPAEPVLPAGFETYTDRSGFRIAVPEGWRQTVEGDATYSRTRFQEPGGRRYLQVEQTTQPAADALADWEAKEAGTAERLAGYRQIRIDGVAYRDYDAADWEFTWRASGGRLHVLSRNVRVSDERAYALYWSVPEDQWDESRPWFDTFAATFRPAG